MPTLESIAKFGTARAELAARLEQTVRELESLIEVLRGSGDVLHGSFADLKQITLGYLRDLTEQIEGVEIRRSPLK